MNKLTPESVDSLRELLVKEPNEAVRQKIQSWIMVYNSGAHEVVDYSPLIGIADSSVIKQDILAWIDNSKGTDKKEGLAAQAKEEQKNIDKMDDNGHVPEAKTPTNKASKEETLDANTTAKADPNKDAKKASAAASTNKK